MKISHKRIIYLTGFLILLIIEILIALYVHDNIIRPYVGDIIVVAVIYCLLRVFIPNKAKHLIWYVLLFSFAVETAQYFGIVNVLGLGDIEFFRVIIGTSFAWMDMLCYVIGAVICFLLEYLMSA